MLEVWTCGVLHVAHQVVSVLIVHEVMLSSMFARAVVESWCGRRHLLVQKLLLELLDFALELSHFVHELLHRPFGCWNMLFHELLVVFEEVDLEFHFIHPRYADRRARRTIFGAKVCPVFGSTIVNHAYNPGLVKSYRSIRAR